MKKGELYPFILNELTTFYYSKLRIPPTMLQNYLKIAFRNLLKFKGYAAVNIFGLAIGIACCLLIVQHLRDELSYDQHHENLDRLYRVGSIFKSSEGDTKTASSPSPLAWELAENYPEVEAAARIMQAPNINQYLVKVGDQSFYEENGFLADSTFFRVMTYDFVEGDPNTALNTPYNIVISKAMADKMFGGEKAVGQILKIDDHWGENEFKVTGVFNPNTYPTHIEANFFMNMRSGEVGRYFYALQEWAGNNLFKTYVRLAPNTDPKSLEAKFPALIEEKAGDRLRTLGFGKEHHIEAVKDIYLYSDASYSPGALGDMTFVYIFAAIAAFILLIACINFMNLSTAKATIRAQEVGVRKVVGATRAMLSGQFLTEAFLYSGVAILLAYVLAELALPTFNQIADKSLSFNLANDSILIVWMVGLLLTTGLLAGSYPALYLSSFSPVKIFKGKIGDRFSARQIRKALVVVQFVVSIALIQGILVIQEQMEYMRDKDLGFNTEAKLVVPLNSSELGERFELLETEYLNNPNISSVSGATSVPGTTNVDDMMVYAEGKTSEESQYARMYWTDADYLASMGFELLTGRFFDENRLTDTIYTAVINENLANDLGYSAEGAIGRKFFWNWADVSHEHEIIGVVKDFHSNSLREEITNHAFFWEKGLGFQYMVANISTDDIAGTLSSMEESWKKINPDQPFDHFFLDEKIQQAYLNDRRFAKLIGGFTLLAIFISCLGLFGLAAFAAESRTKEIGVRKVLGASVGGIVTLLSKDFILLVLISLLIASPLSYYFMNGWLQDFHYQIDMPIWTFVIAGVLAIFVAFFTVSFQSVKAAMVNPVESLKSE